MDNNFYIPLHQHSYYSLLDGLSPLEDLVDKAVEFGCPAAALTDHGTMGGTHKFLKLCKEKGITGIVGLEAYVTNDKDEQPREHLHRDNYHLTLLAKNDLGRSNLYKLATRAYEANFYYKPRASKELLEEYSEGVILLTGCLGSELGSLIGKFPEAEQLLKWYDSAFSHIFLELQPPPPDSSGRQEAYNTFLLELSQAHGLSMVLSSDSHFTCASDFPLHEVLLSIGLKKTLADFQKGEELRIPKSCFVRSGEEMYQIAEKIGAKEAAGNTLQVASLLE